MFAGFNPEGALTGISMPLTYRMGSDVLPRSDSHFDHSIMENVQTLHYKDDYRLAGYLPRYFIAIYIII
jgi:hypothetical protein